jgi:coenzyme F420 biosynthesis associated uncharacterized protein
VDGTAASRLLDWETAAAIGRRLGGPGPSTGPEERARLVEDFDEATREADGLVQDLTGLRLPGAPSRPWVMSRGEWVSQNLRGLEQVLEPAAAKVIGQRRLDGSLAPIRRRVLAAQVGAILGYMGRKVLGQYDLFLPPDDRDIVYFLGPNVIELERRHRFPHRDFRRWLAFHEVTHRVQFEGVPWLRGYLMAQVDSYLSTLELDARKLLDRLRRAREELEKDPAWREMGILFVLMTPEQRETFRRMQALMSLLEGHGNYVMDRLSDGRVRSAERMRRTLQQRRHRQGFERMVQRAVGLDVKVRQYDMGERFVAEVVGLAGADGFARVWEGPQHLPTLEEVARPEAWVERVARA